MKIEWLYHSCFLLTNARGGRLLTDPFGPSADLRYPVPSARCDVATISHAHGDHDYTANLPAGFARVDRAGRHSAAGFAIEGIESFHDERQGALRGENLMFTIEADGLRVAHLGDLGHEPSVKQLSLLGKVDVLLLPVGGYFTIDGAQAARVAKTIGAKLTIPMHYKTDLIDYPISDERPFVEAMGGAEYAEGRELEVSRDTLPRRPQVLVLNWRAGTR